MSKVANKLRLVDEQEQQLGFGNIEPQLIWPGKYDRRGRKRETPVVSLPFQVIEVIQNERNIRQPILQDQLSIFRSAPAFSQKDWRNKLIWGDNLLVMGSLLEHFAGKINVIYIDPPFFTGVDQKITLQVGDSAPLSSSRLSPARI